MQHNAWVRELRAPFLLLPLIFSPLGIAIALSHGHFNPYTALLTVAGAVCLHASVNILNDYFDYKSGIDIITTPTPFSGGSRILPGKELTPQEVLYFGLAFLALGVCIGTYFVVTFSFDPVLIALLLIAAVSCVAYSPFIAKKGLGEFVAGLDLGTLVVVGSYYIQTHSISWEAIIVGIPPGILTACILYNNEFPDTKADVETGRFHWVARWGKKKAASNYKYMIFSAYAVIVLGVAIRLITPFALIALLALPKAITANRVLSKNYDKTMELVPAMANTVMATLWTGGLLLAGYVIAWIVSLIM